MVPELSRGEGLHVRCPTEVNVHRWQGVQSGYIAEASHHCGKKLLKVSEFINVLFFTTQKIN